MPKHCCPRCGVTAYQHWDYGRLHKCHVCQTVWNTVTKKLLTGLVLVLMLAGCYDWVSKDIHVAQQYCSAHGGLELLGSEKVAVCKDGTAANMNAMYKELYERNNP